MDVFTLIIKEGRRRHLSPRTIRTYIHCIKAFLKHYRKNIRSLRKQDIKDYLDTLVEKDRAGNTLNVHLAALKFLFEEILCKRLVLYIHYSKTPKTLPIVLSQEEVRKLFAAISNPKHSLLVRLLYAAGLRVSELVHLRVCDFDFARGMGFVRQGKGGKDRFFLVADRLTHELQHFIQQEQLSQESYLFKGNHGNHYSQRSVYEIVRGAARSAGISKSVHPHTLRHSFATHLIENGYALADVQTLLGHSSMQTTSRYVHLASPRFTSVRSPYDSLSADHKP